MPGGCFGVNNIELQLHFRGSTVFGDSYHYENVNYYVKKKLNGTYDSATKKLILHEEYVTTFHIPNSCTICIKNFYLTYSKEGKVETLQGNWDGKIMRRDRDYLQFDCALSYGLVEYLRTLDMLRQYDWSPSRCVPHGGHQMSLAIAAGLGLGGNESYPDLFQPFGGFPDGVKVENSYVTMPDLPGIGFEGKSDLIREMRALSA